MRNGTKRQYQTNKRAMKKRKLDPLGIYTEEELLMLQYIRTIPNKIKNAMSKLAEGL